MKMNATMSKKGGDLWYGYKDIIMKHTRVQEFRSFRSRHHSHSWVELLLVLVIKDNVVALNPEEH